VVCREIDSIEYNSRPVRRERGIALADIRVWRKINQAAAIGVHDRYIAGIGGIVLEDNLASVRRPVRDEGVAVHICDLNQIIAVRTHRVNLSAGIRWDAECD